jgi:hypothetical protein
MNCSLYFQLYLIQACGLSQLCSRDVECLAVCSNTNLL